MPHIASPTTSHTMGHIRGYSDFFASGFRAVSTQEGRKSSASLYSTSETTDSESEDMPAPSTSLLPNVFRSRRARRRPMSMMISNSQSPEVPTSMLEKKARRSSLAAFSTRLFDRMPFAASADENTATPSTSASPAPSRKARRRSFFLKSPGSPSAENHRELWISTGGPCTPSAPNGGPDLTAGHKTMDPFASSPESKSFFIDLSSDERSSIDVKRDSFLSMNTNSNSSPSSISLIHYPRRERRLSSATMSLSARSRSRRSSFYCRGQSQEKYESWNPDEDSIVDFLTFTSECSSILEDDGETRDDAAQIDWRQFHIDLLTVDEV